MGCPPRHSPTAKMINAWLQPVAGLLAGGLADCGLRYGLGLGNGMSTVLPARSPSRGSLCCTSRATSRATAGQLLASHAAAS